MTHEPKAVRVIREALELMWTMERDQANGQRPKWGNSAVSNTRELQVDLNALWSGTIDHLQGQYRVAWFLAMAESIADVGDDVLTGDLADHLLWADVSQNVDEHSDCIEWPSYYAISTWSREVRPGTVTERQRLAYTAGYAILWWASWRNRLDSCGYELIPKGRP